MRRSTTVVLGLSLLLAAFSAQAGKLRQATDSKDVSFDWPMPSGDGSEIFVATSVDVGGENLQHRFQIVSFNPATQVGTPLFSLPGSLTHVRHNLSVTDDGQWFAFISNADLVPGQNGDRSEEAFAIKRDGTSLTQLTHVSALNAGAVARIAMSGASDRVAFVTSADLTGGNPQKVQQVFVVKRDGSGLTQVTNAATGAIAHMWISDDGMRIAFNHTGDLTGGNADKNAEVFVITVGDALPRQITSSTVGEADDANISGDGSTIVFASTANYTGGNADGGGEVFKADWTTGTITQLTTFSNATREHRQPWPTNDGSQIYFASNRQFASSYEVWKVNSNGTGLTRMSGLNASPGCEHPVVAGNGSRYGVWLHEGLYTGTTLGTEVPLIIRDVPEQAYAEVSPDGQRVAFMSNTDPLGLNPDRAQQVFESNRDGSGLRQLSNSGAGGFNTRPVFGGSRIYFDGTMDPLGLNTDQNNELFGMNLDGTGVIQYTTCNSPSNFIYSGWVGVSDDGSTIMFVSKCNLTGQNPSSSCVPLFTVNPDGTGLTQLTFPPLPPPGQDAFNINPRLTADGTWVVFEGNANLNGLNPANRLQVWRIKKDGTNLQALTSDASYSSGRPDITADGSKIAFYSRADLTGQNTDHNYEIFVYQPAVTQYTQITVTTKGTNRDPRFSRDGRYLYFPSSAELLENDPDHAFDSIYRYDFTTSTLQRSGGLRSENTGTPIGDPFRIVWPVSVNNDGSLIAYTTVTDSIGKNPDEYWDVIVGDYNAQNPLVVSPHAAPTTITFEPEPGFIAYDVIRGSLASLHAVGGTVDLGAVVCVENNSGDTTTVNYPDTDTPGPGQGFFYLFRGSMSVATGPGSYGTSKTGLERVAGSGDCGP